MKKDNAKNEKAMWVFACCDRERVQAMAMFSNTAAYMPEEHAINTVRSRFSIGKNDTVKYVVPHVWNAPGAKATTTSFEIDMPLVSQAIKKYFEGFGHKKADVANALKTAMAIPNPKLGILLFCVDLR